MAIQCSFTKEKQQAYGKTDETKETRISFYDFQGDFNSFSQKTTIQQSF